MLPLMTALPQGLRLAVGWSLSPLLRSPACPLLSRGRRPLLDCLPELPRAAWRAARWPTAQRLPPRPLFPFPAPSPSLTPPPWALLAPVAATRLAAARWRCVTRRAAPWLRPETDRFLASGSHPDLDSWSVSCCRSWLHCGRPVDRWHHEPLRRTYTVASWSRSLPSALAVLSPDLGVPGLQPRCQRSWSLLIRLGQHHGATCLVLLRIVAHFAASHCVGSVPSTLCTPL